MKGYRRFADVLPMRDKDAFNGKGTARLRSGLQ